MECLLIDFDYTLFDTPRFKQDFPHLPHLPTTDDLTPYLYPDTIPSLQYLVGRYKLCLYSEGNQPFQLQKLKQTQLLTFFDPTHVFIYPPQTKLSHLSQLIASLHPLAIIDDKSEIISTAYSLSLPSIQIIRSTSTPTHPSPLAAFTITTLSQLIDTHLLEFISSPLVLSRKIHCVGIKGVGVTPIALMLQDIGKQVTGSDSKEPQITDSVLSNRHIPVKPFSDHLNIPHPDLIVYSGAYRRTSHPELLQAAQDNIYMLTQAEMLAHLSQDKKLLAVCGVGGKTTTSAMLATVFQQAHQHPSWFVGVSNFNNDWVPGRVGEGEYFIAEADEYAIAPPENTNPKFSLYHPHLIICTNLIHDHPDIYPDFASTIKTYVEFFNKLPHEGLLIIQPKDYQLIKNFLTTKAKIETYGSQDSHADHRIEIYPDESFSVISDSHTSPTIFMNTFGEHNLFNAAACYIASRFCGIKPGEITAGISQFNSSKRRLEKIGYHNDILYYDDYAHHPAEITVTLKAFKQRFPDRRLITIFHPHTFSRTKTFLKEFATAFTDTDILIVDDIFASAREPKDPSISSTQLVKAIKPHNNHALYLGNRAQIVKYLKQIRRPKDIILTLGAGDIYQLHSQL